MLRWLTLGVAALGGALLCLVVAARGPAATWSYLGGLGLADLVLEVSLFNVRYVDRWMPRLTMLAAVLQSPRAVQVSIEVVRAFVRLRAILAGNAELARKLAALEKRYDAQFKSCSTPSASSWPRCRSRAGESDSRRRRLSRRVGVWHLDIR